MPAARETVTVPVYLVTLVSVLVMGSEAFRKDLPEGLGVLGCLVGMTVIAAYIAAVYVGILHSFTYLPQSTLGLILSTGPDVRTTVIRWLLIVALLPFGLIPGLIAFTLSGDLWQWLVFNRLYTGKERPTHVLSLFASRWRAARGAMRGGTRYR